MDIEEATRGFKYSTRPRRFASLLLSRCFGGGTGLHPRVRLPDAKAENCRAVGIEFQPTNIIRDVKEDLSMCRVYCQTKRQTDFQVTQLQNSLTRPDCKFPVKADRT
jgi:phytoene/squalene synthetase